MFSKFDESLFFVLKKLKEVSINPIVVGTFPIGINIPGNDIDLACEVHDIDSFGAC